MLIMLRDVAPPKNQRFLPSRKGWVGKGVGYLNLMLYSIESFTAM
jgi:hypothetical protein